MKEIPLTEEIESNLITIVEGLPEDSALRRVAEETRRKFSYLLDNIHFVDRIIDEDIEEKIKKVKRTLKEVI